MEHGRTRLQHAVVIQLGCGESCRLPNRCRAMSIRTLRRALTVAFILAAAPHTLAAQGAEAPALEASALEVTVAEDTQDFLDLSLEDLMRTDIKEFDVLGTHTHLGGQWMVGYQFMPMLMSGIRDGTLRRSSESVLQDYMVVPTEMRMEMHMVNVMFAPSDRLTLMAMAPFSKVDMDHRTRLGTTFTTSTAGLGDLHFAGLYSAIGDVRSDRHRLIIRAGATVPTGSINERGTTPAGVDQKLPYPMQLGSGTYDLHPGVSYLGESDRWAWTAETGGTVRLGTNENAYRLGNGWHFGASALHRLTRQVGPIVRFEAERWGNIRGADPELNPMMVPTADPALRGGNRAVVSVGPLHQSLTGPQLETRWTLRGACAARC